MDAKRAILGALLLGLALAGSTERAEGGGGGGGGGGDMTGRDPSGCDLPEARSFDFLLGEWEIRNEIRTADGRWETTRATLQGEKYLSGCAVIDFWDGEARGGKSTKGITIRAFDPDTRKWSIVWLDNRHAPDFTPLVGEFKGGVGTFYQEIEIDGVRTKVRFIWDEITEDSARWQQSFSADGGKTWETDWIMHFKRKPGTRGRSRWM
ncbi:MAG: DUF1579 domain-containing protein [Gemmatimonadota bacterium]